jgi:large subunit ribosomal protein L21
MYAIVEIAGQQFKVAKDQKLFVHRLTDQEGAKVSFDKVYLLDDGKKVTVGAPAITGASVEAKVVSHLKGDKVIVFKKKRRKGYRVKNGHRQALTELVIESIQATSAKVKTETAKKKPVEKAAITPKVKTAPVVKKPLVKKAASKKDSSVDFSKMTVAKLKAEAKKKGVEGISGMKKAELIVTLSK